MICLALVWICFFRRISHSGWRADPAGLWRGRETTDG